MASQTVAESKEQFRAGDGDREEEEDGEETLDPRVKVSLPNGHMVVCNVLPVNSVFLCIIHF